MGVLPSQWQHDSSTINNIIVSKEASLSAEHSQKPFGGRGSAPNPAGGAHNSLPDPLAGGRGLLPPLQEPHPALGLGPFGLIPNENSWEALSVGHAHTSRHAGVSYTGS